MRLSIGEIKQEIISDERFIKYLRAKKLVGSDLFARQIKFSKKWFLEYFVQPIPDEVFEKVYESLDGLNGIVKFSFCKSFKRGFVVCMDPNETRLKFSEDCLELRNDAITFESALATCSVKEGIFKMALVNILKQ